MANQVHYLDFPWTLCARPLALVGVAGLDVLNNAVHREIWDAFSNNRRPDRAPVMFKLLEPAHEYPPMKPKRNSYEWYVPKGILKQNWMNKHLNEIPAVIAIFYELDWDDAHWNEKKIECSSRVQSLRAALEGRNTRLAVILIQRTAPCPAGEDMFAAERASALCASCELNSKSLFVLPHEDHLHGYTIRLENALYDLAQNYYHHEARNVKLHRDLLNKTTHQYLFVRHQFKIGFLNELKQDSHTAQKNYTQAYSSLLDIRMSDTNALEIKTIAGFINYKLCKLMFQQNLPRDAINQFHNHIELFRNRTGPADLLFEHHAWLAKQYSSFGDVFDEAIRQGLPALQTQHPGLYYQQAAKHSSDRKAACQDICKHVTTYPEPDPLAGNESMEFYGQRPWRAAKLHAEPTDLAKEKQGILALQYREKFHINHSMIIIALLGNAISQYKTYRSPKMRNQLVVKMADEYSSSEDYGKALTLLTHMLWDYRCEKWWSLLTSILIRALACAYMSASIHDYIVLTLEALGTTVQLPIQEKSRIFGNFQKILKKSPPDPEPWSKEEQLKRAEDLWLKITKQDWAAISVEMGNITSCIESKARFSQRQYKADQQVTVDVFIRNSCQHDLQFNKLTVFVNSSTGNTEITVCEDSLQLLFQNNVVKQFSCNFLPDSQDVGKEIQISTVLLYMGSPSDCCILLRFNGSTSETFASSDICRELQHFRVSPNKGPDFCNIQPLSTAVITPRDSKFHLEIDCKSPALLGEWFPISICLLNQEEKTVTSVNISVSLQVTPEDPNVEQATQMCKEVNEDLLSLPLNFIIGDIETNEKKEHIIYMRAHRIGNRNFIVKTTYSAYFGKTNETVETADLTQIISVPVMKPFEVATKFCSLKFEGINKAFTKEPFIVMPHVTSISPCCIEIVDTSADYLNNVSSVDNAESQLKGLCLNSGDVAAEALCVSVSEASEQPTALGVYTIRWKRKDSGNSITSSSVTLPTIRIENISIFVDMCMPAHGWVRTPMSVSYFIHNYTAHLLELELNMEASDAFMFAGHKQLKVQVLPESVKSLDYNLYPLLSGLVALPRLHLTAVGKSEVYLKPLQLTELLERNLPSHVYVMPQGKGSGVPVTT